MKFDEKDQKIIVTELRRLKYSIIRVDEYVIEFLSPNGERTVIETDGEDRETLFFVRGGMTDVCQSVADLMSALRHKCDWGSIAKENESFNPDLN